MHMNLRAAYSVESNDYQVALNHLYASSDDPKDGLWYALPDLAASVLLTGKVPTIVDAFAIKARGRLPSLRKITQRGTVPIDPRILDFFRTVIEERKRLANNPALSDEEQKRLDKALKVLANATSYEIFAEMRREEALEDVPVTCYGIDPDPFTCKVRNPERPGEYCFPPMASLITAAARLMLALLERCVTDLDGTYAMEDTDSMAIVATQRGGLIECEGGMHRKAGKPAIRALSWAQVDAIAKRFKALNPYDRTAIPGSVHRRCCARGSITPKIATPSMAWVTCSIRPIRRARIETGSRRYGFPSCVDRWASPRSRCASRSGSL
jgi:hypothetical protein